MCNPYFTKDYIEFIKACEDPMLISLREAVIAAADKTLELEPIAEFTVNESGKEQPNYGPACFQIEGNAMPLGLAYHITGKEEYFLKARELMLAYCAYTKWGGDEFFKGDLLTGHFCTGMAQGYACFRDVLSEEDRKAIAEATYRLGIRVLLEDWVLPETKAHCFDTMGHNWWAVCASNGGLAAAVMSEDIPECRELADITAKGMEEWFNYRGNPINVKPATLDDGAFYESVSYYNYALFEYLRFAWAYLKLTGKAPFDDAAILRRAARFFVQTTYPSGKDNYFVGFGDCDRGTGFASCVPLLLARLPDLKELKWYVSSKVNLQNDCICERLLHYKDIYPAEEKAPEETACFYPNIGWAVFRDSFAPDSNLLAVKCGDSWNHAHLDAAHFVLYRNGVPEIYDSLGCNYSKEIYRDYFVQSAAHNVVLFNGQGQHHDDHHHHVRAVGKLYNFTDEPNFRYVAADASGPMGRHFRKHLRHFLWLKDFILIYDDIQAHEPGEANFLLHANEPTCFKMLTECEEREEKGVFGEDAHEVTFKSFNRNTDSEGRVKFVSVLALGEETPTMQKLDEAYKITCANTKVYINLLSDGRVMHRNCTNTFDGITTDAVILVEDGEGYAAVNASSIRKDGKSLFDRLSRITGRIK